MTRGQDPRRVCEWCGVRFFGRRGARTCSVRCRVARHRYLVARRAHPHRAIPADAGPPGVCATCGLVIDHPGQAHGVVDPIT